MEHNKLSLEYDKDLTNSILNDINCKYTILYLYIIRNDLFKNLDQDLINKYERIIILDDIYKNNVESVWSQEFIDLIIDLGLFKNIRSRREYDQKDGDFILKMGENTITIERNTILTPVDTLFNMISRRFKSVSYRDFELALTRLKEVRCESTSTIHPFIYEIGNNDYVLSDDLYNILTQFDNVYQVFKIEFTTESIIQRCKEIQDKIVNITKIFDPVLNNKTMINKISKALEKDLNIDKKNKNQKLELTEISIKLKISEGIRNNKIETQDYTEKVKNIELKLSNADFQILINYKVEMETITDRLMKIKNKYSNNSDYLEFLERIPESVSDVQGSLIEIRENAIGARNSIEELENRMKEIY